MQYNNTVGHTLYDCYVSLIRTKDKALGQFASAKVRVCVLSTSPTTSALEAFNALYR
jgi:hypothetical protein